MNLPPDHYTEAEKIAFLFGVDTAIKIAHSTIVEALKNVGLISNCSSMFTGEINQIAKEALEEWRKAIE
jgi:hypothetical protein